MDAIKKDPDIAALMQQNPLTSVSMTYTDAFENCAAGKYLVQISLYSEDKWQADYVIDPINYKIEEKRIAPIANNDNIGMY